jgi:TetR/AcrR family transcriptional repressor of mexJK operon
VSAARGPGRPKDDAKRAAIIAAAKDLFRERGFDEVSMEAVAAAAGVSKMTIYGHFHDKAALFAASVRSFSEAMLRDGTEAAEGAGARDLQHVLVASGVALMRLMLDLQVARMCHVLMGTLMKNPALAQLLHEAGAGHFERELAVVIQAAADRGELAVDSALAATEDLTNLWLGDMQRRVAMGVVAPLSEAEIEARARRAVAVFLRAYRAPSRM